MPIISVDLRRRGRLGGDISVSAPATLEWQPMLRRVVTTGTGYLVTTEPFSMVLVAGVGTCDVPAGTAWQVRENVPAGVTRYVVIPAGDCGYEDLLTVDPATLVPSVGGQAVWDAALATISDAAALVVATGAAVSVSQLAAAGSAGSASGSAAAAASQAGLATAGAGAAAGSATTAATSATTATTGAGTATTAAAVSTAAQAVIAATVSGMAVVATVPAPDNNVLFSVVDTTGHLSWIQVGLDGHPTPASAALIDTALATLTTARIATAVSAVPAPQIITDGPGLAYVVVDSTGHKSELQVDMSGKLVGPFIDRVSALAGAAGGAAAASVVNTATVPVACWGDSMTASGSGYGTLLSTELGAAVRVYGIGGQGPANIAARQGGIPACGTFPSNTIPASGSVTLTSITVPPYTTPNGVTTSSGHITIAGVPGVLTRNDVSGVHTFVRDTPGVAVWCPPTTPMYTDEALLNRGQIVVIWSGRNGFLTTTPDEIVFDIQMMINYLNSTAKRFLIMEVSPAATETNGTADRVKLDALNALFHRTWPNECLTNAQYMCGPALTDSGLTPTSQDTTDLSNGVVPSSLSTDGTHYNLTGRTLIAKFVSNAIKAKGWA